MSEAFDQLVALMDRLRSERGCPWDRAQTPESLKPFLIEEAYEVLEAIESGRAEPLCEELGDLLFQVLFHAQIAKERGEFDIEAVLKTSIEKMTRRHPHVFAPDPGESAPLDSKTVLTRWEEMKKKEAGNQSRKSVLEGIPRQLPALLRAHQIQARAARVGFDWKTIEPVFGKIEEEFQELRTAVVEGDAAHIESELGDLLFTVVNAARFLKISPEDALRGTIQRFTDRFQAMEVEAARRGSPLESFSLEEMDSLWEEAKRSEEDGV
ncbi:MAG: nucleoside triphosphate pyrophosphohydrolase [Nitrospirae bacterium]|nr:nucleoside triphosphate pyrophosphohydrolase [Candidatus Manganitrophaceae bacterium]